MHSAARFSGSAGSETAFDRFGHFAVMLVLVMVFLTGGMATGHDFGDLLTQLLSLVLLAWALLALQGLPSSRWRQAGIALVLFIVAIVALQQLPLPAHWLNALPVRAALNLDLQAAGVDGAANTWSLSPLDSERGLWSLLPALSVFLAVLALPTRRQRGLLLLLVGLGAASTLLGFLQMPVPQDSLLNPYPEQAPLFGGFFSHFNHQATAMGVSVVIIAALLANPGSRDARDSAPRLSRSAVFALAVLGVLIFAALPLTTSRAMVPLTAFGLLAVLWMRRRDPNAPRRWGLKAGAFDLLLGGVTVGVAFIAMAWLRVDAIQEVRWSAATATAAMAREHSPFGAGIGSFVNWFSHAAPETLRLQPHYQNHAHNEYAQWWFESGIGALLAIAGVLALLVACRPRPRAAGGDHGVAVAAWLGCLLLLLHSWVDYPMRTPALMTVAALLAALFIVQRVMNINSRVTTSTDTNTR